MKATLAAGPATLSVIVPVLNEAEVIASTLSALRELDGVLEILVVDGGSDDETIEIAIRLGARLLSAPRGRGSQLRAGGREAAGDILWFVHADTVPPRDAVQQIRTALSTPGVVGGSFQVRFSGNSRAAQLFSAVYPLLQRLGFRYGDATLFVHRNVYEDAGGFQPVPVFEDLELVRRLRRFGRLHSAPSAVTTSSRRFESRGALRILLLWIGLHALYWCGVSPRVLARFYPPTCGRLRDRERSVFGTQAHPGK